MIEDLADDNRTGLWSGVGQASASSEFLHRTGQVHPKRAPAHRRDVALAGAENVASKRHPLLRRPEVNAAPQPGDVSVRIPSEEIKFTPSHSVEGEIRRFTGAAGIEAGGRAHPFIEDDKATRWQDGAGRNAKFGGLIS